MMSVAPSASASLPRSKKQLLSLRRRYCHGTSGYFKTAAPTP